ncbi:MAG: Aspartyl/glutamyl-tRNA(Asn/Gln) amidotransferase subunit B [Alphaproteobacteria bacterium MarineAlpha5_Bin8]|nr:MAG: Aspartyl/glutamyl-tRNA(Asn/Gln) amidotransferase subunit B [Alphaproteobacteria bacterium MarineAlpha5_Bin7]PPR46250.1 MAG: Aspartyl/glutamyl-tRNA(Asn/Gln) amidotransferase subunit B [Alphaproteobacteria bacterium MarineAlpha5_Bin8]PPR53405.1 MAG: Aspartyl/glutamyl-tRNA(Asn/Gln) amidotransferase subunit B [Alphaproteobacteria bacterium MarineAlpha5_Bin6]|tara:strand:+ start:774 stop:2240 length:1467 start_codon:yes stop_codon:yes gene_type:complete
MNNLTKGSKYEWETIIGLEIHAQISSKSKLFSSSSTKFGSEPNTQVSLVDAAMPGMLPVINEHCIRQAIKTGLGLNAKINKFSIFDRKNYFYPDLPQGYQISQYKHPIVGEGVVTIDFKDGSSKNIRITRLHLEQDAGKSLHDQNPQKTYVDLNRSGVALMEIVSEPDMRSSEEASIFITKLRSILMYLGVCDGNMQEGSLRADVNISVRKIDSDLGTRCEIKNLNSIKFIKQAIEFESKRQIKILEEGGIIEQNTLLFDSTTGKTKSMRSKEEAHDYRYFPDPDLLPLKLEDSYIDLIKKEIPELPDNRKNRYKNDYGLSNYDSSILTSEKSVSDFFDKVININTNLKKEAKLVVNWITSELFAFLKKDNKSIEDSPISPENFGKLIQLIISDKISGKIAKDVFEEMYKFNKSPDIIVQEKGLNQVSDTKEIEKIINNIIDTNQDRVKEYKAGKNKLLGFFVGLAMKESKGRANPKILNKILIEKLK